VACATAEAVKAALLSSRLPSFFCFLQALLRFPPNQGAAVTMKKTAW
jgi:hypothetical protein